MKETEITIRAIEPADRDWVRSFLEQHFGSTKVVSRGVLHQADDLQGFIAMLGGQPKALLTYVRLKTRLSSSCSSNSAITAASLLSMISSERP